MMRHWERFWSKHTTRGFMRDHPHHFIHPVRQIVYDAVSKVGGTILDNGCGTGVDYEPLVERTTKYVGVDITPKFIKRIKELFPEVDARVASTLDLPFGDKEFDTVYAGGLIQHMHPNDYPMGIKEMWRVTKQQLIVTCNDFVDGPSIIKRIVWRKGRSRLQRFFSRLRGGDVFDNHYNKADFMTLISSLPEMKNITMTENVVNPPAQKRGANSATAVVIERGESRPKGVRFFGPVSMKDGIKIGGGTGIGEFVVIGDNVRIGKNCIIIYHVTIPRDTVIGDRVFIGPNTSLLNDKYPPTKISIPPRIGNDVVIGGGVTIAPGVKIGDRAVIGCGSNVLKDVPPGMVVVGNPARVLCPRYEYDKRRRELIERCGK